MANCPMCGEVWNEEKCDSCNWREPLFGGSLDRDRRRKKRINPVARFRLWPEPKPSGIDPSVLIALVEKWRDEADGVTAMGYSQQGDRMRDCADELAALLPESPR